MRSSLVREANRRVRLVEHHEEGQEERRRGASDSGRCLECSPTDTCKVSQCSRLLIPLLHRYGEAGEAYHQLWSQH